MEDLSLHILDIAENSVRADAKHIRITITKDAEKDWLRIEVIDDGKGMDAATLAQVRDPFFPRPRSKQAAG
jgi:signal transduction histidine kinase